ncbi:ABC transporter substrate-binding protein [Rathayibacter soli]|uniref:ABC transporter substrate-binding protein n=1 Tax=Rathayibacter soli TaxID=3144168 RepID=UPI0027E5AE2C|nr:peptide ABC transporter substrate-binding protein [Glaciibacter superstes]
MKVIQRFTAVIAVALLAVTGLAGCSGASDSSNVLRIGASAPIDSLNPFVSSSDYSSVVYQYVYPHLTEYDAQLKIVPSFATSWSTSADNLTWTFHTVKNAKWSDGQPLTAKDAAFTMTMMLKYQNGPTGQLAGWVAHLKSATAPNDSTLVLRYDTTVANVLTQMQAVHILPEHVWSKLATGNGKQITTFQNTVPMVSGGPFTMTKYQKNQLALFDVNPNWYGTKPKISGFGLQFFANGDAMVTALKTGQVDMIGESTPATAVATLKAAKMVVSTAPNVGFYDFIINTNPKKKANRELLNPKVREAFEYAINREDIVKTAWLGFAQIGSTIVAPATGWNDDQIKPLPFDIAKANAILDSLGYAKGADGIRVADGHPMSYPLIFPTEINGAGDRMFQIIQAGFKQIGVEIQMRKMDTDAATTAINGANNTYDTFDLAMWDWIPPVDPDFILSVLTCSQWGNNNDSGFCDPKYDAMYQEQGTLVDRAARQAKINEMQQYIFDQRPYIVLNYQDVIEAHSPKWTGFVMSPLVGSVNNLSTQTLIDVHRVK